MRYPNIPLRDATAAVEKLFKEIQRSSVDGNTAAKALGYTGENNGAARVKLAALNAYGLVDRGRKLTKVTELGISVAHPLNDSKERGLREAALNPPLFKEIWDQHKECSESVLASTLIHKGLDAKSAAQAAKIFKENVEFARLEKDGYTPLETPDPAGKPPKDLQGPAIEREGGNTPPMTANTRYLPIPLDIGDAPIPVGMSDSDFDLLLETLKLWKKKIVRPAYQAPNPAMDMMPPRKAIWKNKDQDKPVTITGIMGEKNGEKYYQTSEGTGIPASELTFDK